jgi:hypothetical protein
LEKIMCDGSKLHLTPTPKLLGSANQTYEEPNLDARTSSMRKAHGGRNPEGISCSTIQDLMLKSLESRF